MHLKNYGFCISAILAIGLQLPVTVAQQGMEIQFNRDIRPILSDKCYACHGPDEKQREADLRLDMEVSAKEDLGGYSAIVPGDSDESELISRILTSDSNEIMPPSDHRKSLTESEKQLLKKWIDQGARWQEHWAWIPPKLVEAPATTNRSQHENYIDGHISAKLAKSGIKSSEQADKITLIRRLYFDLVGLPPTPEQVAAFIGDASDDAYEKLVDDLLTSPHFGERLAIYWLDQVRYADTVGYHGDQNVSVSPYRDYVIDAFNENMPFDQFTREQLAGDLCESPTDRQLIASGYNRLGMMSAEGGVQPEEYLTKYAADRVRTTASVWMGVTLGCAECHDHKFDPFTIEDFYSFEAFFADIKEKGLYAGSNNTGNWGSSIEVPDEQRASLLEPIDGQIKELEDSITLSAEGLAKEQADWETDLIHRMFSWTTLRPKSFSSFYQVEHEVLNDDSILMKGNATDEDCYVVTFEIPQGIHHGLKLEVLPHKSLPKNGPGRAANGNFVVTQVLCLQGDLGSQIEELKKVVGSWSTELLEKNIELKNATATIEQASGKENPYQSWPAKAAIDQDQHGPTYGWAILPEVGKENELVVNFSKPLSLTNPEQVTIVLQQYHGSGSHVLGRFRFSITSDEGATANSLKSLPGDVQLALKTLAENRTKEQSTYLSDYYLSIAPRFKATREKIEELKKQRKSVYDLNTRTSLITESVEPREIRVLPRGDWMDKSGAVVEPRIPELFGSIDSESSRLTRMDLANWIVSKDNPLTARTFVNRIWKLYFGTGISKVLDDLGSQGEWPTNSELLDSMAVEFIDSGWDIKDLIRTIVTSKTYRQSSKQRKDLEVVDPYNRLLARQARFRLDAELIRDNALAVSGLLIDKIGGRSNKPYQPDGLYRHLNFPVRKYQADKNENQFRRGLYTHWQRQFLHPAMKAFDAPAREECTCERPRSNTPIGALVLLNDPSFVEAARNLAAITMQNSEIEVGDQVSIMFQRALSRQPNEREVAILSDLYRSHLEHFQLNQSDAKELLSTGISENQSELPVEQLAAWTSVARSIMNMHEFVTRN